MSDDTYVYLSGFSETHPDPSARLSTHVDRAQADGFEVMDTDALSIMPTTSSTGYILFYAIMMRPNG